MAQKTKNEKVVMMINQLRIEMAKYNSELHSERMKEVWKKRKEKEAEDNAVAIEGGEL